MALTEHSMPKDSPASFIRGKCSLMSSNTEALVLTAPSRKKVSISLSSNDT